MQQRHHLAVAFGFGDRHRIGAAWDRRIAPDLLALPYRVFQGVAKEPVVKPHRTERTRRGAIVPRQIDRHGST